jgi:hypothetical protein
MPRTGSGAFTRVHDWTSDADAGIDIRADRMDEDSDDFAQGISDSIAKDGQTTTTQTIPFAAGIETDTIESVTGNGVEIEAPTGVITLTFPASGSPFNAQQTCDINWTKIGNQVTLNFKRLAATANGTPSSTAAASATPLSALIPIDASSALGVDATQVFWAPVGNAINGSSNVYGVASVGIDNTGALQIIKTSNWANSNLNGWSAFSISYRVAP